MAAAQNHGFEIVVAVQQPCRIGATRFAYRYENVDFQQKGMLYVCNGKVSWQYNGSCTPYHGSCVEDDMATMVIKFDCHGREDKLKSTILVKREPGLWQRFDYAGRHIILEYLGADSFCTQCMVWHEGDYSTPP